MNIQAFKKCGLIAVVKCEGQEECAFFVSISTDTASYHLRDRIKVSKFIKKDEEDLYIITNKDRSASRLTIILHSHTGDADLIVSRKNRTNPKDDPERKMSDMSTNRDSIDFFETEEDHKNKDNKNYNSSLLGDYYISVKGFTNSFYSIYYYLSNEENPIHETNLLDSGVVHTSSIEWGFPKLLHFFNREKDLNDEEKKPFIITTYAANCVGNFTIQNKKDYSYEEEEDNKLEVIRSKRNYRTFHNQAIIQPEMKLFNQKLYDMYYTAKNFHHKTTYDNSSCLFYASGITYGKELLLSEGIPHLFTFEPTKNIVKFNYIYPHVHHGKNPALIDIFFTNKVMDVIVNITFDSNSKDAKNGDNSIKNLKDVFTYRLLGPKTIIINHEDLERNCDNGFSCNLHISMEYPEKKKIFSELSYRIIARSNNLIPVYLKKNVIKDHSVLPNNYQYYYTDIKQNEVGKISLKSKSNSGILVAKIVPKKKNKNENINNKYNVVLPTIENTELKYNYLTNSIEFDYTKTSKCSEGCELYIGVIAQNLNNFHNHLFEYSIIINTGNIHLGLNTHFSGEFKNINTKNNIQYFTVEVLEDESWNVKFNLNFNDHNKGKLLINVGELGEEVALPDIKKNNYFTSEEKRHINYQFKLNKKPKKFVVGVYIDPLKYKNVTSSSHVRYDFYPGDNSQLNNKNFFEIKLGQDPICETQEENSYCDFLMILPTDETIIFYTNFLKSNYNDFDEGSSNSVILANVYETSKYKDIVNNESLRPRMYNNPSFRSDILTESLKEFSQFPDNNILAFKNPYEDSSNKNKTFVHNVLCISVYIKKPTGFILMNNKKVTPSSVLQPEINVQKLYYVDTFNSLNIEVPHLIANRRNLMGGDENKELKRIFSVNIKSLIGDASVNYERNNYKLGHEKLNMKVIIGEGNSKSLKINAYGDDKIILKPYLCIVSVDYMPIATNLFLGESLDILYPSYFYPKKFNYFYFNDTNIKDNVDISFNFKILKSSRDYLTENNKDQEFYLKSRKLLGKEVFTSLASEDEENLTYDLGEYDPIHKVGTITNRLDTDIMNVQTFDIVDSKQTKILEEEALNSFLHDYILVSVNLGSDNFKYSKASLAYNTYFYSSIYTGGDFKTINPDKINYHIHRLNRRHINHKFFQIELSSCGNNFGYALRDYDTLKEFNEEDYYLNRTNLNHEFKQHYGKKVIEVKLDEDTKDLILIIFPLKEFYKEKYIMKGNEKNYKEGSYYAEYMIRYRTSKGKMDLEQYRLDEDGQISVKVDNIEKPENLNIRFGPVLEKNEYMNYGIINESIMNLLFYDADKVDSKRINTVCFFDNSKALVDLIKFENKNRHIKPINYPLEKTANYQIEVIAESKKDNTYLSYSPSYIYVNKGDGLSPAFVVFLVFCIIFLLFIVFWIYRKLRLTKQRLDYEVSDIRNMANVANFSNPINNEKMAKSNSLSMMEINDDAIKKNKYTNLSE